MRNKIVSHTQEINVANFRSLLKSIEFITMRFKMFYVTFIWQSFIARVNRSSIHRHSSMNNLYLRDKKVQVGNDQEKAQSERNSHSKNRGGKY